MLFRFARRLANWEKPLSADELQKREFKARDGGPDLRPSLQECDDTHENHVRAYAEHATRFDPPDRAGLLLSLAGIERPTLETKGTGTFAFTRDSHREFELKDLTDLHRLITEILDGLVERRREAPLKDVDAYVSKCLAAKDPEWEAELANPKVKKWLRALTLKLEVSG